MSDEATAVRAEIEALVAPLRSEVYKLETLIATRSEELEELRKSLRDVKKMLAYAVPSPTPAKKKTTVAGRVAQETVAAVETRLHEKILDVNGNGGFTATSLRRDHGFDDISQSTMSKVLAVLHERDLIRLDHRGRGGAHYFKVVA